MTPPKIRAALRQAKHIVIKIGSRALMSGPKGTTRFSWLADQVVAVSEGEGPSVVLVSSGAVALGREKLGLDSRPEDIALLQTAAAVGQSELMHLYGAAFGPSKSALAQVLLSHADLADRGRYLNARYALEGMRALNVIPIVNENDTVAIEEIQFGDNDQLAAMVATLSGADLLLLLTDVNGVHDLQGSRLDVIRHDDDLTGMFRSSEDDLGRGGMSAKVQAARRAAHGGTAVVIADAHMPNVVARVVSGEDVGSLFLPEGATLPSRKAWIAYTLRPTGAILVDRGAERAVRNGASLLSVGAFGVRGTFAEGDSVELVGPSGVFARGLTRFDVAQSAGQIGAQDIVMVHRDDLVILAEDISS